MVPAPSHAKVRGRWFVRRFREPGDDAIRKSRRKTEARAPELLGGDRGQSLGACEVRESIEVIARELGRQQMHVVHPDEPFDVPVVHDGMNAGKQQPVVRA
jgi:hypothetical protein